MSAIPPIPPAVTDTVMKTMGSPFGALTLAVLMLWGIMNSYQGLVDKLITDHAEDRALYRQAMTELSSEMGKVSKDLQGISSEIKEIRRDLQDER